ncbi:MAG TPA: hypothetical protein VGL93_17540 [Streptosporangiaceae bacterium]|jgi:hypothetical protein
MSAQAYFALRALRGGRWPRAIGYAVPAAAVALVAGGGLAAAVPAGATVAVAAGLASAAAPGDRGRTDGLGGIAREWARAHPWRFAAGPAAALAAALLVIDLFSGWPPIGAALAGLAALAAPRLRTVARTAPVRTASALATRRLALAPAAARPVTVAAMEGAEAAPQRIATERGASLPFGERMGAAVVPLARAVGGGFEAGSDRGNFREMPGVSPIAPSHPRSAG